MAKWRNRLLLIKPEVTYGTAPSMTGTDALLVPEIDIVPLEVELKDRELITGYYGNTEKVLSMRMSKATISVEYANSGTRATPPKWGPLLRACGWAETITAATSVEYNLISGDEESAAMVFYADGVKHILRGSKGTPSLSMEAGEIPKWSFEFTALYTTTTAEANPTATYTGQGKPFAFNSENTTPVSIHGFAACLESFSLDMANDVVFWQLAGCSERVEITDRKPTGAVKIEAPTLAAKNYFSALSSQTLGEFSFTHGSGSGGQLELTMPSCNLGGVGYSESNGIIMLDIPFMPNPVTGNDEVSLLLT